MRKAGLVVWEAHQQVAEMIRPGVTTLQLDRAIESVFEHHNATPLFKGVPGIVPFPNVTCVSVNDEVVHGIPSNRILEEGDIVSIDTGCRIDGWCGDSAWTYSVGQIDQESTRLMEITEASLNLAMELLARSERWSQIAGEIERLVVDAGYSVVKDFSGHGIGRDLHEPPQAPNYSSEKLLKETDFQIEPGLVLAIEPMVNVGGAEVECLDDHWTQRTVDRKRSAHFEHTIAITNSGPIRLTAKPGSEADDWLA